LGAKNIQPWQSGKRLGRTAWESAGDGKKEKGAGKPEREKKNLRGGVIGKREKILLPRGSSNFGQKWKSETG